MERRARRTLLALSFLVGMALLACAEPAEPPPPQTSAEPVEPAAQNEAPAPKATVEPKAAVDPKAGAVVVEEPNMIADKPGAEQAPKKQGLLEELKPEGRQDWTANRAYILIGESKSRLESISKDLDDGGKEITRLITTCDHLVRNATELANLWPHNETYRDACGSAKSRALSFYEELGQVPRNWSHVRWAFNDTVQAFRNLRRQARELAEAEPKPTPIVGKDGKVTYQEPSPPPVDPAIAAREKRASDVERAKEAVIKVQTIKQQNQQNQMLSPGAD